MQEKGRNPSAQQRARDKSKPRYLQRECEGGLLRDMWCRIKYKLAVPLRNSIGFKRMTGWEQSLVKKRLVARKTDSYAAATAC